MRRKNFQATFHASALPSTFWVRVARMITSVRIGVTRTYKATTPGQQQHKNGCASQCSSTSFIDNYQSRVKQIAACQYNLI